MNIDSIIENKAQNGLSAIQEKAQKDFETLGFPTTKMEDWKYTNVKDLIAKDYQQTVSPFTETGVDLSPYQIDGLDGHLLVFINGQYCAASSQIKEEKSNCTIAVLSDVLKNNPEKVEAHLGKYAASDSNGFVALNTAGFSDGCYVEVPNNAIVEQPIHLLFLSDSASGNLQSQPRNLFVVGDNAQVKIVQNYQSLNDTNFAFTNVVTELVAGRDAIVDHYILQLENEKSYQVNTMEVNQGGNGKVSTNTLCLSGALLRNDLHFLLNDEHAESFLNGLYMPDSKSLFDNHTLVDHAVPNCMSDEFYKGIMDGQSKGVFNGKIMVRPDAQKTNAFQSNKNILISDNAQIYTKPQLEIFADDVRCTHGATTGQLNEEALFYMQARGIGKETARRILLLGFAGEVLERLDFEPIKNYALELVRKKLGVE